MAENNNLNDPKYLYKSLKKGDRSERVMEAYARFMLNDEMTITTVHRDTILHLAIYMRQENVARDIVSRCRDAAGNPLTKKNALGNTVLHEAASAGMEGLVEDLLSTEPKLLSIPNQQQEMPLYTAAHYGKAVTFSVLAGRLKNQNYDDDLVDLHLKPRFCKDDPKNGTTSIFHAAIKGEFFELALDIVRRYPRLVNMADEDGMTGLHLLSSNPSAFWSGTKHGLITKLIYSCAPNENAVMHHDKKPCDHDPYICDSDLSDDETRSLFKLPALFRPTSPLRQAISSVNKSLWKILRAWEAMNKICEEKKCHGSALELAKLLILSDYSWDSIGERDKSAVDKLNKDGRAPEDPTDDIESKEAAVEAADAIGSGLDDADQDDGHSDDESIQKLKEAAAGGPSNQYKIPPPTPLLLATSYGIIEIVEEILKLRPWAIEHVSILGQNILHLAIKHRQWDIFKLVTKMESPRSRLARRINISGFTILHQVGNMKYYRGSPQPGPALQLQEELEWFEKVKNIVPAHYKMRRAEILLTDEKEKGTSANENDKNKKKKMMAPHDYFRQTHKELHKDAQEWLERTSQSCSTVAGLIATVAFAAAFTIPGGNDDEGHPILLDRPFFMVFIATDALSLASSLTSLVMFLSILTSPFELLDFHRSLPRKLIFGFSFLFFSVAVTMLAFASTLMLVISTNRRLTMGFIYCVAFLPVSMFAILQFPLYVAFKTSLVWSFETIRKLIPWPFIYSALHKTKTQ